MYDTNITVQIAVEANKYNIEITELREFVTESAQSESVEEAAARAVERVLAALSA